MMFTLEEKELLLVITRVHVQYGEIFDVITYSGELMEFEMVLLLMGMCFVI